MTLATLLAIAQVAWAEGELTGKFTVNSSGKQVCFSQGNLQYIGSADSPYWKFAENQWDYLGTKTSQNSTDSNVDRDLFGWATSGYNHGATSYQPYSTNTAYSNYYAYGNASYNLYDQTGKADWGYNAISNGGNTENSGWRTLTGAEWFYLFDNHIKGWATVNGVGGYVIRPDGVSTAVSSSYTDSEWATEEAAGSIFLPAAGDRDGNTVANVGIYGHYWSSSTWAENGAYAVNFQSGVLNPQNAHYRNYGFSVRLVKDVTVYFAAGSGGEGWNISPATPYEGQTVTVSYSGPHKVKSVSVVPKGALTGKFSVSSTGQVQFSKGNLQATYDGSAWSWAFATNQWDYIGDGGSSTIGNEIVTNTSPYISGSGTVDLFGWVGASSTWTGAAQYGITSSKAKNAEDGYGKDANESLKSDWGNKMGAGWRTLNKDEWNYLFFGRTNAANKYGHGSVNGVNGMIILPDSWTLPDGLSFTAGNSAWTNSYTTAQWSQMESAGAVFLPAAGYRYMSTANEAGSQGFYWSSSSDVSKTSDAYRMYFASNNLVLQDSSYRYCGYSVRLVRLAE